MISSASGVLKKLTNTKNYLINSDREAAYFFQFLETGVLDDNFNFTEVPLYDQQAYGDIWYGGGTVSGSGCGLTAMCMALSYIYNDLITPEELAAGANEAYSLVGKMERAAEITGTKITSSNQFDRPENLAGLLEEGKLVVISVNGGSHFVLCTGVTDDGKYLVNDPYGQWQKDRPLTWEEMNKAYGYVWIVDPYENVGNAHTSIGHTSVSQSVIDGIQEMNDSGETVGISNKTYLRNIQRTTAAKVAGEGHYSTVPTTLSLLGENGNGTRRFFFGFYYST